MMIKVAVVVKQVCLWLWRRRTEEKGRRFGRGEEMVKARSLRLRIIKKIKLSTIM